MADITPPSRSFNPLSYLFSWFAPAKPHTLKIIGFAATCIASYVAFRESNNLKFSAGIFFVGSTLSLTLPSTHKEEPPTYKEEPPLPPEGIATAEKTNKIVSPVQNRAVTQVENPGEEQPSTPAFPSQTTSFSLSIGSTPSLTLPSTHNEEPPLPPEETKIGTPVQKREVPQVENPGEEQPSTSDLPSQTTFSSLPIGSTLSLTLPSTHNEEPPLPPEENEIGSPVQKRAVSQVENAGEEQPSTPALPSQTTSSSSTEPQKESGSTFIIVKKSPLTTRRRLFTPDSSHPMKKFKEISPYRSPQVEGNVSDSKLETSTPHITYDQDTHLSVNSEPSSTSTTPLNSPGGYRSKNSSGSEKNYDSESDNWGDTPYQSPTGSPGASPIKKSPESPK